MTVQSSEVLYYNGKRHLISNEPLRGYLVTRPEIKFRSLSTACWRGYEARWKIKDRKLYLTGFKGYVENKGEVKLDYLFPGQKIVEATWFTDCINLEATTEEILHSQPGVKYLQLLIRNGFVVKEVIAEDPTADIYNNIKLAFNTKFTLPENKSSEKLVPEDSITYMHFFVGGFLSWNYEVFYIDNSLYYNQSDFILLKEFQIAIPTTQREAEFIQTMNAINVWKWEPVYDTGIYDGIQWSLELELDNCQMKSYGSNAFPGSKSIHRSADFKKLLHAICKLIGEENFFSKML